MVYLVDDNDRGPGWVELLLQVMFACTIGFVGVLLTAFYGLWRKIWS